MKEVEKLFKPHTAKSHPIASYDEGVIPLISNGLEDNGFVKYVQPQPMDKVFQFLGLCISAFCEATVQHPPFIARGNAGSGLTVLEPIEKMDEKTLLWYAAYFNKAASWRFSYGRMASTARISKIKIPEQSEIPNINLKLSISVPITMKLNQPKQINLNPFPLTSLFKLKSGDYHKADDLPEGNIPLISCGFADNGVVRYCSVPKQHIYQNTLTVAYNGQPLTSKYHPYKFAAKDDVAVLLPQKPYKPTTFLFIQMMLNREQWRYSYGRKCFREKLSKMQISIPLKSDYLIDEQAIEDIISNTQYWKFIKPYIS